MIEPAHDSVHILAWYAVDVGTTFGATKLAIRKIAQRARTKIQHRVKVTNRMTRMRRRMMTTLGEYQQTSIMNTCGPRHGSRKSMKRRRKQDTDVKNAGIKGTS